MQDSRRTARATYTFDGEYVDLTEVLANYYTNEENFEDSKPCNRRLHEFLLQELEVDPEESRWNDIYVILRQATIRRMFTDEVLQSVEYTRLLLEQGDVDPSANNNATLIYACRKNLTEVALLLLADKRVDPVARNNDPLLISCCLGNTELVTALLASSPRVNPRTDKGACLLGAASGGHVDVIKILLNDKRMKYGLKREPAVQCALANGHAKAAQVLLGRPPSKLAPGVVDHNYSRMIEGKSEKCAAFDGLLWETDK